MTPDWSTIASLATAFGTLVLSVATFSAVRSSSRTAKIAEQSLQVGLRPLLMPTRFEDRPERVMFGDDHWVTVDGSRGAVEVEADVAYLVIPVRNVGNGIAVLHSWVVTPNQAPAGADHPDLESFRRLSRDLYISDGDQGFWQGAIRNADDPALRMVAAAAKERSPLVVHLLYGDHEGGQRTISQFTLVPDPDDQWTASVTRHWNVDRSDPR